MARPRPRPQLAAAIIERHDNHVLIALPESQADGSRWWRFPRGPVREGESTEVAMRRITSEQLGLEVEIVVGQPPIIASLQDAEVELRYFFCGVIQGEAEPGEYAELRWVPRGQLREYEFDDVSRPVVEWILESR